ncbi:MAG TPA: molybdenum cofactor guanylyltransferase MobA [Rhodobacteraceae bacterium]|nr:molybdenum cofactor guanylyltransferase MobA [Paracoccaceae bacterium]
MKDIPAVILAGGQATRMGGGDKCLLDLGGALILDVILKRLAPQTASIALNANGDPLRFRSFGLAVIPDTISGFAGPLSGVLAAMDWAAETSHEHVVTVAGDTPFFPENLVSRLQEAARTENTPIALAATKDPQRGVLRHPTFGLWPVGLRDDLRAALEEGLRKVVLWTDRHGAANTVFPAAGFDPFFNVNTTDDLEVARRIYRNERNEPT